MLSIPPGSFRLRVAASGYKSTESEARTLAAGEHITMPDIVLRTAPWAISGRISDSRDNPVAGAAVAVQLDYAFPPFWPRVTSDAAGRYRFASESPHLDYVSFSVSGPGVEPLSFQQVACCNPDGDTINDIRVMRVLSVSVTGPSTLRVGESVILPAATVTFDDGTQSRVSVRPTSNSSIVAITSLLAKAIG
jgi:hypothetical protein